MNRDQKAAVIEEIAADISASQAIFAIDYRGITVAQADALRIRLGEANASFRVVKNSLTERAAEQAGAPALTALLEGPTALTFVRGDAATAAKAVADFARTSQLLAFKGGLMDGAALSSADVTSISRLPSRDILYGQLVGLVASPIAGLARTLNALIGGLAVALGGVLEQREATEGPAAAAPATAAHTESAATADAATEESAEQPEAGAPDQAEGATEATEETGAAAAGDAEGAPAAEGESAPTAELETEPSTEGEAEPAGAGEPEPPPGEEAEPTGAVEAGTAAAVEGEPAAEPPGEASTEPAGEAQSSSQEAVEGETAGDPHTPLETEEVREAAPSPPKEN
jgi:large subunit ribosomal protein L10